MLASGLERESDAREVDGDFDGATWDTRRDCLEE